MGNKSSKAIPEALAATASAAANAANAASAAAASVSAPASSAASASAARAAGALPRPALELLREVRPAPAASPERASAVPSDTAAAEVQASVSLAEGLPEESIAVQRIRPSRPPPPSSSAAGQGAPLPLQLRNEATIANLAGAVDGGAITSAPLRGAGHAALLQWEAMHANPALLDSEEALLQSRPAMAALQVLGMAEGGAPPPGTVMLGGSSSSGGGGGGGGSVTTTASTTALTLAAAASFAALASSTGVGLGSLLEQQPRRTARELGVAAWPPPPPQSSAFDQLVLGGEEGGLLSRGQLFELYARSRADPEYWTPARLAQQYSTREEWVAVLLEVAAPPMYAQVEGEQYGVHAIRPVSELG